MRVTLFLAATILSLAACSKTVEPEPPGPTIDLTGYFVRPSAGYVKFFSDASTQMFVQDTTVNSHMTVDVVFGTGAHEYHRIPDRAWVGTLNSTSTLFLLSPPIAAIPELMPESTDHVANSAFETQSSPLPVRRISRLIDTGLTITVPAGMFDSVVLIRQEFWVFITTLGMPDTTIDSVYRWFAPGADEIRRVLWRDGEMVSATRELDSGFVNGVSYPIP